MQRKQLAAVMAICYIYRIRDYLPAYAVVYRDSLSEIPAKIPATPFSPIFRLTEIKGSSDSDLQIDIIAIEESRCDLDRPENFKGTLHLRNNAEVRSDLA